MIRWWRRECISSHHPRYLHGMLEPLKCTGDHEHQPIEGTTRAHGHGVARSTFSERYPRKFARLEAKCLLKKSFPKELPLGAIMDSALVALEQWFQISSALAADARMTKRSKVPMPRQLKASSADRSLDTNIRDQTKRMKMNPPTDLSTESQSLETHEKILGEKGKEILEIIEPQVPRVGKKMFDQPSIISKVQEMFPEKIIKGIIACKGTERTMAPPTSINSREAPYRRAIMKLRSTGKVQVDEWEKYDEFSKRQIIWKSCPCRMNITVFAANPIAMPSSSMAQPTAEPSSSSPKVPHSRMVHPESSQDPDSAELNPPEVDAFQKTQHSEQTAESGSKIPMDDMEPQVKTNRFNALPREEQATLRRAHQNLCHPSPEQLSTVLRAQGVRPEIFQAVYDMKCSTCAAHQQPKIARPSTLKNELDFNDKVFIDGVAWTSKAGRTFHFYHILDQATNYHLAVPAPSRAAENAVQCIAESWFQWAGPPNTMVTDAGTEFTSEVFTRFLRKYDVKPLTTSPYAHWQTGCSERHGHILQTTSLITRCLFRHIQNFNMPWFNAHMQRTHWASEEGIHLKFWSFAKAQGLQDPYAVVIPSRLWLALIEPMPMA